MKSADHTRPCRRRARSDERTPLQIAWARADALLWRAVVRAEVAAEAKMGETYKAAASKPEPSPKPANPTAEERALFAAAIARAEFGRFYWSEKPAGRRKATKTSAVERNGKTTD